MAYVPNSQPFEDLPSQNTPVTASWLNQVDDTLADHDEILSGLGDSGFPGIVDAKGDLIVATGNDTAVRLPVGANGRTLAAASGQTAGVEWSANPTPEVVTLTDGATVNLDASAGRVFKLTATGNRTIAAPTGVADGRAIVIRHEASGANRTLSLNTGNGGFRFGTDVTALTATTSGTSDYIGAIYDAADNKWDVVGYQKGF